MAFLLRLFRIAWRLAVLGVIGIVVTAIIRDRKTVQNDHSMHEYMVNQKLRIRYSSQLQLLPGATLTKAMLAAASGSDLLSKTGLVFYAFPSQTSVEALAAKIQKAGLKECMALFEGEDEGLHCKEVKTQPATCFHQLTGIETSWVAEAGMLGGKTEYSMKSCTFVTQGAGYSIVSVIPNTDVAASEAVFQDVLRNSELLSAKPNMLQEHTVQGKLRIRYPDTLKLGPIVADSQASLAATEESGLDPVAGLDFTVTHTKDSLEQTAENFSKSDRVYCTVMEKSGPQRCSPFMKRSAPCFHGIVGIETTWSARDPKSGGSVDIRLKSCTFKKDDFVCHIFSTVQETGPREIEAVFQDVLDRSEILPDSPNVPATKKPRL